MHPCWCILLNECGLNSNFHLNSNLFELGIEKEIEKETNPNPIPEAHQLNPVRPTTSAQLPFFPLSPRPAYPPRAHSRAAQPLPTPAHTRAPAPSPLAQRRPPARHRPNPLPSQPSRGALARPPSADRGPRLPGSPLPLTTRARWQLRLPRLRNARPRSPAANLGEVPIPGTHAQVTPPPYK